MSSIISLSGWTQPHDALQPILPEAEPLDYSAHDSPGHFIAHLAGREVEGVFAWSLGGQLALRALKEGAIKPKWLVLLAPPIQFVNDDGFSGGMDPTTYSLFRESYTKDAERTSKRFHGLLAKGDKHMKRILNQLSHHERVVDVEHWLPWLDDLAMHKKQAFLEMDLPPTLLVQGAEDAIVPKAQALAWQAHYPNIRAEIIEGMGHTPHLHDEEMLKALIAEHRSAHS